MKRKLTQETKSLVADIFTDTTNIKQDESLENIALRYAKEYPDGTLSTSFLDGCHYQKEKDKAIIESLLEALKDVLLNHGASMEDRMKSFNNATSLIQKIESEKTNNKH